LTALADAAAAAPTVPGVYLFFGSGRSLVYVGKASNLRRRLAQHARPRGGRLAAVYPLVTEVGWEELPDEDAAAAREADLILALRPAFNASLADDGRWTYVHVATGPEATRFTLSREVRAEAGRSYGCFPYLGVGVLSRPAAACGDGYTALLRLLWAAGPAPPGSRIPGAVRGSSPPAVFEVPVAPSLRARLHSFLTGTSDRLLDELDPLFAMRDAYLQPGLRRDRLAAAGFFRYGPRAIRELRLRHGLRWRPLSQQEFEQLIRSEVEQAVGPFSVTAAGTAEQLLGRRKARGRAIADALHRLEEAAADAGPSRETALP